MSHRSAGSSRLALVAPTGLPAPQPRVAPIDEDGPRGHMARLERLLARHDPADGRRARRFADALPELRDAGSIWLVLSWLEQSPVAGLDSGVRFAALTRLAQADCAFLRSAAYRWLARMFLVDLRYEQHAKRILRSALDRETGIDRARVERLLRQC